MIEDVNDVFAMYDGSGTRKSDAQSHDPFWNKGTQRVPDRGCRLQRCAGLCARQDGADQHQRPDRPTPWVDLGYDVLGSEVYGVPSKADREAGGPAGELRLELSGRPGRAPARL